MYSNQHQLYAACEGFDVACVIFTFEMKTDISDQILSQLIGGTARLADSQRSERGAWQLALGLASSFMDHACTNRVCNLSLCLMY